MDYIRFKKRLIVNTPYNVLLFSSDINVNHQLSVSMVNSNGVYLTCVFGTSSQIETFINLLNLLPIDQNLIGILNVNSLINDLDSLNISSDINDSLIVSGSEFINIAKPVTVQNINLLTNVLATIFVPPPVKPLKVNETFNLNIEVSGFLDSCNNITITLIDILTVDINMFIDNSIHTIPLINNNFNFTIIMDDGEPVIVSSSSSNIFDMVIGTVLKNTQLIKINNDNTLNLTSILAILMKAKLVDHDSNILSILDNKTLKTMDYIEI